MLEVSDHWVKAHAIDGYRLDAAWAIRERDPEFWPRFAAQLRRLRPEAWLIAEAPANDAYYDPNTFTAAYDWTHELGKHSWEHVFDQPTGIARRLHAALGDTSNPSAPRVLRFLNNNDTGARFITRHGEPLTRVATAALLTLPGVPCLYAFDEEGAEFEPYTSLHAITQRNPGLRAFHQRWLQLRRARPELRGAGFEPVHVGEHDEVLAYLRGSGAQVALVVLNFAGQATALELALPRWQARSARDLAGGAPLALQHGQLHVSLEPWDARVFVPE
jgi:glycosidase